jgi:hypothetical protein
VAKSADLSIEFVSMTDVPIELALTPPAQIGIDRLLTAWLAYTEYGAPTQRGAIAVTLGTALTLTCVDRSGRLIGGAITPSPVLASRALATAPPHCHLLPSTTRAPISLGRLAPTPPKRSAPESSVAHAVPSPRSLRSQSKRCRVEIRVRRLPLWC